MKMWLVNLRRGMISAATLISVIGFAAGCGSGHMAANSSPEASGASASMEFADSAKAPAMLMKSEGASSRNQAIAPSSPMAGRQIDGGAALAKAPMAPPAQVRQVIRRAELVVRVENVEKAEKTVGSIVRGAGGYVETASSTDLASAHPVLDIALRIPVETFDATIAKFEALGVRLSKKVGSEDVTGQLVDMDARLKTLRAQEDVYRDMLKNRTQLDDVFNIQSQLTQVRTQIESISGQRKSQAGLAAMSTISLTLQQNAIANAPTSDPNWMAQTWAEASSGASGAFRIAFAGLVWILAFSPFWIPVLLILRKAAKPLTEKKSVAPPHSF